MGLFTQGVRMTVQFRQENTAMTGELKQENDVRECSFKIQSICFPAIVFKKLRTDTNAIKEIINLIRQ